MATLDDIAQELGVSKATVSKALNGAKDVSKKMQQAVVEKAVELGYSRMNYNTAAPRIAIFVINMDYQKSDDFGYDIIVGFRKAAEPAGFVAPPWPGCHRSGLHNSRRPASRRRCGDRRHSDDPAKPCP